MSLPELQLEPGDAHSLPAVNAALARAFARVLPSCEPQRDAAAAAEEVLQRAAEVVVAAPGAAPLVFPFRPDVDRAARRGALQRCVGMVQDVQDAPTFYQAHPRCFVNPWADESSGGSGGGRAPHDDDAHDCGAADALPPLLVTAQQFYVIPVPGNRPPSPPPSPLAAVEEGAAVAAPVDRAVRAAAVTGVKRGLGEEELGAPAEQEEADDAALATLAGRSARTSHVADAPRGHDDNSAARGAPTALNHPHPPTRHDLGVGCLVTAISPCAAALRVNDLVEFFGFVVPRDELARGREGGDREEEYDDELSSFCRFERLPAGAVTFMTAIAARRLESASQLRRALCRSHANAAAAEPVVAAAAMMAERQHALEYLTRRLCCGDALAAEYVLLLLCSRVLYRSGDVPVGDFPLSLHHAAFAASRVVGEWAAALQRVSPVGAAQITIAHAGAGGARQQQQRPLVPRKDYDSNCIVTGQLQLARGSLAVLHMPPPPGGRSSLSAGDALSAADEDALVGLIHHQRLAISYGFHKLALQTDTAVLLLTECPVVAGALPPVLSFATTLCLRPLIDADARELDGSCCATAATAAAAAVGASPLEWLERNTDAATQRAGDDDAAAQRVLRYIAEVRDVVPTLDAGDEPLRQRISDDLQRLMREAPRQFNNDPMLHNNSANVRMGLTRAFAASCGCGVITWDHYIAVRQLEEARLARNDECIAL